jgi:hypothetical protein
MRVCYRANELGGPLNVLVSSNKEIECPATELPGVQEVIAVSRREGSRGLFIN